MVTEQLRACLDLGTALKIKRGVCDASALQLPQRISLASFKGVQ